MKGSIFALTICLGGTAAFWFFDVHAWNDVRVKFGTFNNIPLNEAEAVEKGFTKLSECDEKYSWRGKRYAKGGDLALIILYDISGNIAGMQTSIPNNQTNGYPQKNLQPSFLPDGDRFVLTVYFQVPSTICSRGLSDELVENGIIGTGLYIQNSTRPEDSILIPNDQEDLAYTKWTEGNCFVGMGKHFWYNLSEDMDCGSVFPVFLLYKDEKLVGLGFALTTDIESETYEHPPESSYSWFMKVPPKCLATAGRMTTMHIYFTSNPYGILCL